MKKGKVINNLHEQIKSLEDNNVPYKYYSASNNVNIRNYLSDRKVRYSCPPNSYLSLNELLKFIDSLDHHDSAEVRHLDYNADTVANEMTNRKVNKEECTYPQFSKVPKVALHNNFLVKEGNLCDQADYHSNVYHQDGRNYDKHDNCDSRVNYGHGTHSNTWKYPPDQPYEDNPVKDTILQNNYCRLSRDDPPSYQNGLDARKAHTPGSTSSNPYESNCIMRTSQTKVEENSSRAPANSKDGSLLKNLLQCRVNLSKSNNITDPEKVISTKNLKLLLLHHPNSIDDMKNLNLTGFGEDKIKKYGYEFLKVFLSGYTDDS
ncbi:hypothetical protein C922_03683 [Plasmodium inui San Antonio 1]|uniref:HRDC domain-containing protein n=1 Tax=Plasmodium inui San Antonio 1 TaxID=1237626 RepID=W7AKU2_9APIC|nr:hypothetical protein C922_03683 [Plasmodium inui San Antonio 1]EUD65956.1 hypothetical protein C922_03683 [Plasmodium inui San Antonio 1]